MINLCKFCKNEGYSEREYKNIKNNINVLSDALVQEYFSNDVYYTVSEVQNMLEEIGINEHKFYSYILNNILEKLY